jgi:uncharacterized protein YcbX
VDATIVGTVAGVYRAPVKSIGIEVLQRAEITWMGLVGNRQLLVWDIQRGHVITAKHPDGSPLLMVGSHSVQGRFGIDFPDGESYWLDEMDATNKLSDYLGRKVGLIHTGSSALARTPASYPTNYGDLCLRPGMGVDSTAVHALTTASIDQIGMEIDEAAIRYRPTFIVKTIEGLVGFCEDSWTHRLVRVGSCTLVVRKLTERCPEPKWARRGLSSSSVLPQRGDLTRLTRRVAPGAEKPTMWLGVYLTVVDPGTFDFGDIVYLLN